MKIGADVALIDGKSLERLMYSLAEAIAAWFLQMFPAPSCEMALEYACQQLGAGNMAVAASWTKAAASILENTAEDRQAESGG
jgi:hypothetical protein